jgi:hypothetical protein
MRGDGICKHAPEDSAEAPFHCLHIRPRHGDYVCCWCGDLFLGDDIAATGPHGRYQPRRRSTT